jgi:hypothetical protein
MKNFGPALSVIARDQLYVRISRRIRKSRVTVPLIHINFPFSDGYFDFDVKFLQVFCRIRTQGIASGA